MTQEAYSTNRNRTIGMHMTDRRSDKNKSEVEAIIKNPNPIKGALMPCSGEQNFD